MKSIIHVNCSQSLARQRFFLPPSISCSCSLAGVQVQYRIQSSPVMAWNAATHAYCGTLQRAIHIHVHIHVQVDRHKGGLQSECMPRTMSRSSGAATAPTAAPRFAENESERREQ